MAHHRRRIQLAEQPSAELGSQFLRFNSRGGRGLRGTQQVIHDGGCHVRATPVDVAIPVDGRGDRFVPQLSLNDGKRDTCLYPPRGCGVP